MILPVPVHLVGGGLGGDPGLHLHPPHDGRHTHGEAPHAAPGQSHHGHSGVITHE